MSSEATTSYPFVSWTPSDLEGEFEGGIDSNTRNIERQVSVVGLSNVVPINKVGMLKMGVVCAVVQRVEFLEYKDVEEPSCLGRPLGILPGENPESVLVDDDIDHLHMVYRISESVKLRATKEHE